MRRNLELDHDTYIKSYGHQLDLFCRSLFNCLDQEENRRLGDYTAKRIRSRCGFPLAVTVAEDDRLTARGPKGILRTTFVDLCEELEAGAEPCDTGSPFDRIGNRFYDIPFA